ncbi:N-6 DNA methylase [Fusobacterium nucleatum]|nr:N-6 DNA methylase [Fusobacterium nucleatum]BEP03196.1 N-6 DNA methylase [Fusobacterium nucleatum]
MEPSISNIVKRIQNTDQKYNYDEIFFDWIKSMFYAYANTCNTEGYKDREDKFKRLEEKHGEKTMQMFCECHAELVMLFEEKGIDDYLGKIHHQLGVHNKMKGQFFTPFHLAKMMAETQVSEVIKELEKGKGKIKITDSACGSACLLLGMLAVLKEKGINYQKNIMLVCSDLDENAIQMAYIQLSLTGVAAKCENKNALTGEIFGSWFTLGALLF